MNTFDIIQRASNDAGAIVTPLSGAPAIRLPEVRVAGGIQIRPAVEKDIESIDYLQKMHSHMVGWAPRKQLEANIAHGEIIIAEARPGAWGLGKVQMLIVSSLKSVPVGYCHPRDQYMKRDDVGIIYQLNVLPYDAVVRIHRKQLHGPRCC